MLMIKTQKKEALQMLSFHKWSTICLKDILILLALFPPSTDAFQDHAFAGQRDVNYARNI